MYRLIFSDMDETFLDERHQIPAANLDALARLREKGVRFVPSSGRGYLSIMDNFAEVDPALMEGSYVLSYNGATINRFGDPEPLCSASLDAGLAERLWQLGVSRGVCMHVYLPDCRILVRDCPASEAAYLATLNLIEQYPEDTLAGLPVIAKMLYMSEDFAWLHEFAREVEPLLGDQADITYSSGKYLEVIPKGANKGTGLRRLAELLGVPVSQTIAVGDSSNDLEMIQAAGLGVGVANVTDDVRPYCDLVLDTPGPAGALPELIDRCLP